VKVEGGGGRMRGPKATGDEELGRGGVSGSGKVVTSCLSASGSSGWLVLFMYLKSIEASCQLPQVTAKCADE
jgi:hypothetical protein